MFSGAERNNNFRSAIALADLIYVNTVRHVRKTHRNPVASLLLNIVQTVILVAAFYILISLIGLRGSAVRGDFILYLLSGIFLFLTHTKAVGAVTGAEGPTSAMMQHAPMNTAISISAAALSTLYIQTLSAMLILFVVHVAWYPIEINDAPGAIAMFLLAWFSGVAVGLVFLSIKPWFPEVTGILTTVYSRANMIASGKMFAANSMPGWIISSFDWNPLFHAIDQCRGFTFINYNPHFTSITYPLVVSVILLMIGLMAESYARKHASVSWGAGQ